MFNSVRLYPTKLLCPGDSLGKNTGVGCHALFPGDLPDPGVEPMSPTLQVNSLLLGHGGIEEDGPHDERGKVGK